MGFRHHRGGIAAQGEHCRDVAAPESDAGHQAAHSLCKKSSQLVRLNIFASSNAHFLQFYHP